jgi:hypothetical protein
MSNEKDPIKTQAENLVMSIFKITVDLAFDRPDKAWKAAITIAKKTIDEKLTTVRHQKELFSTALDWTETKELDMMPEKAQKVLGQWCDDHIKELKKMKEFVMAMQKCKVSTQITHILADGTETKTEIR